MLEYRPSHRSSADQSVQAGRPFRPGCSQALSGSAGDRKFSNWITAWKRASAASPGISETSHTPRIAHACRHAQPSLRHRTGRWASSSRPWLQSRARCWRSSGKRSSIEEKFAVEQGDPVLGGEGASLVGEAVRRHEEGLFNALVGHHAPQFPHRLDADGLVPGLALDDRRAALGIGLSRNRRMSTPPSAPSRVVSARMPLTR